MRKSIGRRLFLQIMIVLFVFIAIALLFNTVLLKPIYKAVRKSALIASVDFFNSLEGEYGDNLTEILKMEEKLSGRILIYDDEKIIYISAARVLQGQFVNEFIQGQRRNDTIPLPDSLNELLPETLAQFLPKATQDTNVSQIDSGTIIEDITSAKDAQYLILRAELDSGANLIVVSEMQSLSGAVKIFNIFLMATAVLSMGFIAVMSYYMSKRFVKPIRNMNEVTKKISQLDFNADCEVNTSDELEELGHSINALSDSLESTIEDLKKELENAKRLEELRKRFVSTVSHDLKTPISLIHGYSIGLKSDVCDKKEKRDYYAEVIAEESERLGDLVNELMDLTQLEAGFITLNEVDFELSEFIDETVEKFQEAHQSISINYKKPNSELWCLADAKLIGRVLDNYLSNALRHVDEKKDITVSVKQLSDRYEVFVYNTGEHIPKEKISEIWNSFYRVDDARTRAEGGHGLGLSIVKNIQAAHEMPYSVKNAKDGVEFMFGVKKGVSPDTDAKLSDN